MSDPGIELVVSGLGLDLHFAVYVRVSIRVRVRVGVGGRGRGVGGWIPSQLLRGCLRPHLLQMGVRWVPDGCSMGVRWVSDGFQLATSSWLSVSTSSSPPTASVRCQFRAS